MAEFWIGDRQFPTKTAAGDAIRAVLHGHRVGTELADEEYQLIRNLLDMHPEAQDKIGAGVAGIRIGAPRKGPHPCFEIIHTDCDPIDFSYKTCLKAPSIRSQVHNVMRFETADQRTAYLQSRIAAGTFVSDESGTPLDLDHTHVSYFQGPPFAQIADLFAAAEGGWEAIELSPSTEPGPGKFVDRDQAERWRQHHGQQAVFGLLTAEEGRRRPHRL